MGGAARIIAPRSIIYLTGFAAFVALSAGDGDMWLIEPPCVARWSLLSLIEKTTWLHLLATVFPGVSLIEIGSSPPRPVTLGSPSSIRSVTTGSTDRDHDQALTNQFNEAPRRWIP
jgi:hypothetical protein